MSILINCHNIGKRFGAHPLFEGITFGVAEREKVGIVGPNGAGKSTLLKILAGEVSQDDGSVSPRKGLKLVYIPQESKFPEDKTVGAILHDTLKGQPGDFYEHDVNVQITLSKVGFQDPEQLVGSLSGGWKKRLSIAQALVQEPELLLLDEPTNHLDLDGILWLEGFLKSALFAFVVISHDRYFLENITNKIMEVNRVFAGGLFVSEGNYSTYMDRKATFLAGEEQHQASLANKVRREVEWLRQGVKARTTKQQARINEAMNLQEDLAQRKFRLQQTANAQIEFQGTDRKTKKLIQLNSVSKSMGPRRLISDLDFTLSPGVRLGLLGLNGSGKTTLLKILAGKILPDGGKVDRADQVRIVYFEQNRESLNHGISLKKTLAPDGDSVVANDKSVHVATWARKFLFRPEQLDVLVGKLSGGEQARVQIAKLMLEPADVLLLDEPTNDLDISTLEVLEESLTEFPGAVVLVTHDRYMLDRVSNTILALDGAGGAEIFADCAQWQEAQKPKPKAKEAPKVATPEKPKPAPKKLTWTEQKELDQMESKIADAEAYVVSCQSITEDPLVLADVKRLRQGFADLQAAQDEVERLYARWEELEGRK